MGHALTYVSFDILRRIMSDYFKYDVRLCMNITDIDDKIIMRANEQKIDFKEHARHFENEFMNDCEALNIRLPTVITRVSEYTDEIIAFIEKIISNGFAYASNGSVYFDVISYEADPNHEYAKLDPGKKLDWDAIKEGEGALGEDVSTDKKSP
jgi:cysteinyl-tRNA synthetase